MSSKLSTEPNDSSVGDLSLLHLLRRGATVSDTLFDFGTDETLTAERHSGLSLGGHHQGSGSQSNLNNVLDILDSALELVEECEQERTNLGSGATKEEARNGRCAGAGEKQKRQ